MRLLDTTSIQLTEFLEPPVKYAILSHCWSDEEISYEDLRKGTGSSKKGYRKILKACEIALNDGSPYIWIDTCCIDKSSSAELSEAINSMFAWYQNAKVCYAYFEDFEDEGAGEVEEQEEEEDVESSSSYDDKDSSNSWFGDPRRNSTMDDRFNSSFKSSKWFQRGWTLQELIAPRNVIFYAKGWTLLGEKADLRRVIREATGIDEKVLRDSQEHLASISIAKRMSWAARRVTTRPEDAAYCLLGIFNVNMALLYGEGGRKAFFRLQEEIIKNSSDHSIFAWSLPSPAPAGACGILAESPSYFTNSASIIEVGRDSGPFAMTNHGLKIRLSTIPWRRAFEFRDSNNILPKDNAEQTICAILDCQSQQDTRGLLAIPLSLVPNSNSNIYYRWTGGPITVKRNDIKNRTVQKVFISRERPIILDDHESLFSIKLSVVNGKSWTSSDDDIRLHVDPALSWTEASNTLRLRAKKTARAYAVLVIDASSMMNNDGQSHHSGVIRLAVSKCDQAVGIRFTRSDYVSGLGAREIIENTFTKMAKRIMSNGGVVVATIKEQASIRKDSYIINITFRDDMQRVPEEQNKAEKIDTHEIDSADPKESMRALGTLKVTEQSGAQGEAMVNLMQDHVIS